tara:strand:- start:2141 stop:2344 length:204 start_codon:yes stop_codon:yes gene_type:complete
LFSLYKVLGIKNNNVKPKVFHVEEEEEITDEIEKSLWEIKDSLDLPTEEVEMAVSSRRLALKKSIHN